MNNDEIPLFLSKREGTNIPLLEEREG